jgi:hypothetical protein
MTVRVDESRSHPVPGDIERFLCPDSGVGGITDKDDPAIVNAEVCAIRFISRTVVHEATREQDFNGSPDLRSILCGL